MFNQSSESNHGDHYSPLNISTWGEQQDNTLDNSIAAWHSIADPNTQISAGGVGLGNLHRKGGNYKPITDEAILQQRLKQPLTTKEKTNKKSQQPKPKKIPTAERPEIFANRQAAGGWGTGKLLSVPFWEQSSSPSLDEQQQATPSATHSSTPTTSTTTFTPLTSSILPPEQPLIRFNIKLVQGISMSFIIRKGDDIESATDNFISDHHLCVSPEARDGIVRTVTMVYEAKLNSIKK